MSCVSVTDPQHSLSIMYAAGSALFSQSLDISFQLLATTRVIYKYLSKMNHMSLVLHNTPI